MEQSYIYFNELPLGCMFLSNGIMYKKRSTRTAMAWPQNNYFGLWHYFSNLELCVVGLYSRLETNYFNGAK